MIKFPAYFSGFSSRSDGSAGLRFATQELTAEDFGELKNKHNAFGWLLFSENPISEKDIPDDNPEEDGLSSSERLRKIQFVYWKQKINTGDFETWRKQQMEKIMDKYRDKLD